MLFADAFDHVVNSTYWDLFETQRLGFHLPFGLTKFVILELIAAGLILGIFIPLARASRSGEPPRGLLWNMFEVLLTFVRDRVAKPTLGEHRHKALPERASRPLLEARNKLHLWPGQGTYTSSADTPRQQTTSSKPCKKKQPVPAVTSG